MDGAADLLVEQDLAGALGDPVVGADTELAEATGTLVRIEHLYQELLPLLGGRVDDPAALEPEANAGDLAARVGGGQVEGDLSLGGVLDRASEELAVGHVVLAAGRDELAALDPEPQIGALAPDVDLAPALDPLGEALGLLRLPLPGANRVLVGREAGP